MISVIIPAYNSADFIGRTIDSVLKQTYTDFELLVIDDGSTDSTGSIVASYIEKDARIKYFYKKNGGVSSARNFGLIKAIGEFVSFLDSDDLWSCYFLELMYNKLVVERKLICFCGYIEKRGATEIKYPKSFNETDVLKEKLSVSSFRISTDCWLIDRNLIISENIFFSEGCNYMEDFEFFVKLLFKASNQQLTYVSEYLSFYILRPQSLSCQQMLVLPLSVIHQIIEVLKRIYDWMEAEVLDESNIYLHYLKISMKERYVKFLWDLLLVGKYSDFKSLLKSYNENQKYIYEKTLSSLKFRLWSLVVFNMVIRCSCRIFLRPIIFVKRKIKIQKLYLIG